MISHMFPVQHAVFCDISLELLISKFFLQTSESQMHNKTGYWYTLVRIAGCPTPNALLRIAGSPTPNALIRISVPYFVQILYKARLCIKNPATIGPH